MYVYAGLKHLHLYLFLGGRGRCVVAFFAVPVAYGLWRVMVQIGLLYM